MNPAVLVRVFLFFIFIGLIIGLGVYGIYWLVMHIIKIQEARLKKWHDNKEKEAQKKIKEINK